VLSIAACAKVEAEAATKLPNYALVFGAKNPQITRRMTAPTMAPINPAPSLGGHGVSTPFVQCGH
jgi:hypothetical protein